MPKEEIKLLFIQGRGVKITTNFKGVKCMEATKFLEDMGQITRDEKTKEYYQRELMKKESLRVNE